MYKYILQPDPNCMALFTALFIPQNEVTTVAEPHMPSD